MRKFKFKFIIQKSISYGREAVAGERRYNVTIMQCDMAEGIMLQLCSVVWLGRIEGGAVSSDSERRSTHDNSKGFRVLA